MKSPLRGTNAQKISMEHHNIDELFAGEVVINEELHTTFGELDEDEIRELQAMEADSIAILPLRGMVVFPGMIVPIVASRPQGRKLLKEAERKHMLIGIVAQHSNASADVDRSDLFDMGCVSRVHKLLTLPDGQHVAMVEGIKRIVIGDMVEDSPYMRCRFTAARPEDASRLSLRENKAKFNELFELGEELQKEESDVIFKIESLKKFPSKSIAINNLIGTSNIEVEQKQALLELDDYVDRMNLLFEYMADRKRELGIRKEIRSKTDQEMTRQQREYFLNQQMRVIQDELGGSPIDVDVEHLSARAAEKQWPEEVAEIFGKELDKLRRYTPQSPEYSIQVNYLTLLVDLPWSHWSKDNLKMGHARKVLDRDHYGLDKVKERIVEFLAVLRLTEGRKAPILCLVGPPGTGKTSLGKSIAEAMGRKYVRVALGGLHDESEIRGHRRTYVGAMPGRIISGLKQAGTSNPVFVLDEIDKIQSNSFNGDPMSALLEVLDPEQNRDFHDNYLDMGYDLSHVMFIATANTLSTIPPALLDRMEIIELSGYVMEEKLEIARRHLVPRQLKEHGFNDGKPTFRKQLLQRIINDYTRESGVRQLEKAIAKVLRHVAVEVASDKPLPATIEEQNLAAMLGLPIHQDTHIAKENLVGVVTGLAWTSVGGEILFIESSVSKGNGTLTMTGNLGEVMKESATLAFEYIKSHAEQLGIDQEMLAGSNVHIHVPEGATPKDGPSAGIALFVSMVSSFTGRKVRSAVAMTGEITLRGAVTPVGGLKEKLLAAKRCGVTNVILSAANRRDVEDINQEYLRGLTFHYIEYMPQALELALTD